MKQSKTSNSYLLYAGAVIAVIALIVFAGIQNNETKTDYSEFAQCVTDEGMTMYGAWWCSHCNEQKEAFGDAFELISYTECSAPGSRTMSDECDEAGIEGYPTWVLSDGTMMPGKKTMEELAEISECEIPVESE